MEVTFIHAADLHLGRVFSGLRSLPEPIYKRVVDSGFRAFEKLVTSAIEQEVDFVLLAGDVFDSNSVSLRTLLRFRQQLERLDEHGIRVYMSHGNHDPLTKERATIAWPDNVSVFPDETVTSFHYKTEDHLDVHIYGFSYTRREVITDKSAEYIKEAWGDFHIAMLHGNVDGQTDHDPYAPFTVNSLLTKQFDYWALGHIHQRQILHKEPPILYPGNIQGMHRNERGEKGCMLVTLAKNKQPKVTFIPTSDIVWHEEEIEITDIATFDRLLAQIQAMKERLRKERTLLYLRFVGSGVLHEQLQQREELDDLLWSVNDGEEGQELFVWVFGTKVQTVGDWDREELRSRHDFIGELIKSFDEYTDFDEALHPLLRNQHARKFLDTFTEEEKEAMLEQAERLLLTQLMKEYAK